MTDIVTYYSENAPRENLKWTAYIVLANGEYWGIRFSGATEEAVKANAIATWNAEKIKYSKKEDDPWADVKAEQQHHFANKVWMLNRATGDRKRVPLTEITLFEKNGYVRGGPRSK